jgi:hypothetical protein
VTKARAPVGQDRVVKALFVKGQSAGHLPADPVSESPCGLAVRESLQGLQHHDRCHRVGWNRGPAAARREEVFEHRVGEEVVAVVGEERLHTSFGHESATQCRRVKQFSIGFAESLHRTILNDNRSRNRYRAPIYSTVS